MNFSTISSVADRETRGLHVGNLLLLLRTGRGRERKGEEGSLEIPTGTGVGRRDQLRPREGAEAVLTRRARTDQCAAGRSERCGRGTCLRITLGDNSGRKSAVLSTARGAGLLMR